MKVSDFVPPALLPVARRLRSRGELYPSFEAAGAACGMGYETGRLVEVVVEKARLYASSLAGPGPHDVDVTVAHLLLAARMAARKDTLTVLDFGGGGGTHYSLVKALLEGRREIRWHVVETRQMCRAAKALEDGHLAFFDSIEEARKSLPTPPDLVWSSSALQYVGNPYETLSALVDCAAPYFCLTRLGLSSTAQEYFLVQESSLAANGRGPLPEGFRDEPVKYPVYIPRKDRFEQIICRTYALRMRFDPAVAVYRAGRAAINQYGYLAVFTGGAA
jgi:putative methyltransferase (TIGR04325 family)